MFRAQDCEYQSQQMSLPSLRMDFEFDGNSNLKYGGAEFNAEWQNDNLIKLTSRDTTKKTLLFWQRAELPPAYKAFFETLKD